MLSRDGGDGADGELLQFVEQQEAEEQDLWWDAEGLEEGLDVPDDLQLPPLPPHGQEVDPFLDRLFCYGLFCYVIMVILVILALIYLPLLI
jgi:hypothetical protein